MVKKEQGQDNYFNQQSILLTFASLLVTIVISYIAVNFLEMFFITCLLYFLLNFYVNLWLQATALAGCNGATTWRRYRVYVCC